ncbi:putative ubiquitin-conjugating enzyme E2 38 [Cornus florida]|uniref:putative ubiquitin-conjugating enzyme E2 38 n=1 Tax=Cornus florida TaxID=4283 RepID=UPI002896F7B1|nr:putative ubiquitin-conjugating enzyme E2 38 [Cornus florida]
MNMYPNARTDAFIGIHVGPLQKLSNGVSELTGGRAWESRKDTSSIQFQQFDIVTGHSDHYYSSSKQSRKEKDAFINPDNAVHKKIMKEWKILEKGLPETIYVRVYEDRINLLRAVIVGPSGTPYHDGLFFFDIVFPSNYPHSPPKVHYHAHGLRVNPNLYETGFVCLSLINTWNGNAKERWDSSASTILQVLVSIQGLVLNEEPYFNEPVNADCKNKDVKNQIAKSLAYKENVFILSCKTMLYTLQKPPKHFRVFINEHFGRCRDAILGAIQAYRDGVVRVGHYQHDDDDDGCSSSSSRVRVTSHFETNANKLYSELRQAFDKKLGMADENINIVEKETSNASKKPKLEEELKHGTFHKVIGVLKSFWN